MSRLTSFLPERIRASIFYRFYWKRQHLFPAKFRDAPLTYAKNVTFDLLPTDVMHGQIAFTGFYELPLTRRVVDLAREGGTMVDIGANVGYFSALWVAQNPKNLSFAIEPSPRNIDLLRNNITKNNFEDSILVLPFAASDCESVIRFDVGVKEQTGWGQVVLGESDAPDSIEVLGRRLEDMLPEQKSIELMKIDIEGYELFALRGSESYLRDKKIKEIHFEQSKPLQQRLGIEPSEPMQFLKVHGYRCIAQSPENRDVIDWMAIPE